MDILEQFLHSNNLQDDGDIDALLECADITRQLIAGRQYPQINRLIGYTVHNNLSQAFCWIMEIVQEEIVKADCPLQDFVCPVGGCIENFDSFIINLQVDFDSIKNHIEKVYDKNGVVEAFFNVMVYKTAFDNIFLISSENFDNKDNDYIRYSISFVRDANCYIK